MAKNIFPHAFEVAQKRPYRLAYVAITDANTKRINSMAAECNRIGFQTKVHSAVDFLSLVVYCHGDDDYAEILEHFDSDLKALAT